MKKILILLMLIAFTFCGCNAETSTTSQKEAIKINLPKDDTVNGYRIEESETDSMPDTIIGIDVSPNNNASSNQTNSSNKTTSSAKEDTNNISYCGNKNSKKFHKSTCGFSKNIKTENKVYLASKEEFLKNGYTPCKLCNP